MNSIKGQKDSLDIAGLAFYSNIDYLRLKKLLDKYEKPSYIDLYVKAISHIEKRLLPFLNLNESTNAKMKKKTLKKTISKSV